jgi:hypothetical protein
MKKLFSLALIIIIAAGSYIGCKKDKGVAPELPPLESMTIDFSNFASLTKSGDQINSTKGTETSNWEFAAFVSGVWRLLLTTELAIPIASFKIAVDQDPSFLSTKTWQWSFNVSAGGDTYKARLTGQIETSDVLWTMYITKEGTNGYPEFVWFEGTSKLDGTGGQWTLNKSSASPEPMLQIDWTKTGSTVGNIKYTYVKTGESFTGSYIEYGLTSATLNAFYNVHFYNNNALKFSDVNVEWNTTTKNGRVKCTDYLLGEWYCWDSNKINVVCE